MQQFREAVAMFERLKADREKDAAGGSTGGGEMSAEEIEWRRKWSGGAS